jgi:hypothetical protein
LTKDQLFHELENLKAYKKDRVSLGTAAIEHGLLPDLIELCHPKSGVSHQACWSLEQSFLLFEHQCYPFLQELCALFTLPINSSGMRSLTKISSILTRHYYSKKLHPLKNNLDTEMRSNMLEGCFQELIDHPDKTANIAWSTLTLYELGKEFDWVYPELLPLIEKILDGDPKGYRSCGSKTLEKIKNIQKVS